MAITHHSTSKTIAVAILTGFNKHYFIFRSYSKRAKNKFEEADWLGVQALVADRVRCYDDRVDECVTWLHEHYPQQILDETLWKSIKTDFIALLTNHKQPELAETFFNSVSTRMLDRSYYKNQYIFVRPAIATEYIESDEDSTFKPFYPDNNDLSPCVRNMLLHFNWRVPFTDIDKDVTNIMSTIQKEMGPWPFDEFNLHIQMLQSAFYRNKCAYILGQIINGNESYPFAIAVVHDKKGGLKVDAALLNARSIAVLFSFARAYFLVEMEVPSNYVNFLRAMLPMRSKIDLYNMLGLQKQGKNIFWRDFLQHLHYSEDKFILAPGIKGLVMSVFMLPSFPYVFKVIKDKFGPNKDFDRDYVRGKYLLVKKHDRVGRMADTLEFSKVAIPRDRCTDEMLNELREFAPSMLEENDDYIIIKHCYIERRLKPLNIFLPKANAEQRRDAIIDYGQALKDLAAANIFPGDMLFKNFGITRFGRVIFYDYDEIEYMTSCNFRRIPPAPYPEMELSGEVWYPVNKNDVFPEEFGTFLLTDPEVREVFMAHHAELLTPEFWQEKKDHIEAGLLDDFYPYPDSARFEIDGDPNYLREGADA
ncbi:bifunctional isocitrate dehydrogenase kinase/phosphatase [Brackiella oedipodis]|uniref:bifunctional isocitrate dehydrogenase kinase/phosphatase n=1 Tax=Brackiella oedipodis TaxID=124225 RepID=UPI0004913973|nr:bifunctional isocitrate dehydrogenase kinase/phosphatase [Brackiella oedipodis]